MGKSQYFSIWKCFRCFCTQGSWGSAHSFVPFLVTRLPGEKQHLGAQLEQQRACAGSRWQHPGYPWLYPVPLPDHPRTHLRCCPGCCTPTPVSGGYSHHCRQGALAAGAVGGGDESAWHGAAQVAEAADGGDSACGGRETAPVRSHAVADALPEVPRGFTITCAVSSQDSPWKPSSLRLSPSTGDDHSLPALPLDTKVPLVGMGLSPGEGQQTWRLGGHSNTGVTEIGLSWGADGHEKQSGQGGCRDLHGVAVAKGTTSRAGAGVAAGLFSARCSATAATALLLFLAAGWVQGFKERKWGNYVRIAQFF